MPAHLHALICCEVLLTCHSLESVFSGKPPASRTRLNSAYISLMMFVTGKFWGTQFDRFSKVWVQDWWMWLWHWSQSKPATTRLQTKLQTSSIISRTDMTFSAINTYSVFQPVSLEFQDVKRTACDSITPGLVISVHHQANTGSSLEELITRMWIRYVWQNNRRSSTWQAIVCSRARTDHLRNVSLGLDSSCLPSHAMMILVWASLHLLRDQAH